MLPNAFVHGRKGDFEKEKVVVSQGFKLRTGLLAALGLLALALASLGVYLWWPRQAADVPLAAPVVTPAPEQVNKIDKPPGACLSAQAPSHVGDTGGNTVGGKCIYCIYVNNCKYM